MLVCIFVVFMLGIVLFGDCGVWFAGCVCLVVWCFVDLVFC